MSNVKILNFWRAKCRLKKKSKTPQTPDELIREFEDWKKGTDKEIAEKEAQLHLQLGRLYLAGASREAKNARAERTSKLCELGALVEKSGFGEMPREVVLGMLVSQFEYLTENSHMSNRWAEKGKAILSKESEVPSTGEPQEHGQ